MNKKMALSNNQSEKKVIIIPCSGIGKSFGTIGREATYIVTDELQPDKTGTLCLSLLTMKDSESQKLVQNHPTITIDGCPSLCAKINVEKSGGKPIQSYKVYDVYREHRNLKSKKISTLDENGVQLARILAGKVSERVTELLTTEEK